MLEEDMRMTYLSLITVLVLGISGCVANYTAGNNREWCFNNCSTERRMTSDEAKKILATAVNDGTGTTAGNTIRLLNYSGYVIHFDADKAQELIDAVKAINVVNDKELVIEGNNAKRVTIPLINISAMTFAESGSGTVTINGQYYLTNLRPERAKQLVDAIAALNQYIDPSVIEAREKQAAIDVKRKLEEANFEKALQDYRNAAKKTVFPEDARKYKVQAEDAVKEKNFAEAGNLYAKALDIAPWWPEGHFNRALVLGETGQYETAIIEMKRYMRLVPEAPNSRAAQDKIYSWERKVGK